MSAELIAESALIGFLTSFAGGWAALMVWFHFDFDGWWEQRRIERGRRMDERAEGGRLERQSQRGRRG